MQRITIRVPDNIYEHLREVQHRMKLSQSEAIRLVLSRGVRADVEDHSDSLLKVAVQSLCLQQRLIASQPQGEKLLSEAREDATSLLRKTGVL